MTRRERGDEGTIVFLTLGLAVVLMALVVVVVDVSVVVLAKRNVANAADGAALVAAQQPDVRVLNSRRDALDRRLPLDVREVRRVVGLYQREEAARQPTLTLSVTVTGGTEAVVQARRTVRLPFASRFGVQNVVVRAIGRARSPVTA